ncbi:hypothetical protein FPHYL_5759 [Fusarium phyllophilum]|uniref:Uncharacterized protein n=1 Tax=Fusarium phyllophilum TaxID=47803 RepID=A0A8H5JWT1_9HYPO|nr:hypothetical protein FPHYL_5759 [Fusarium phyllophilum]
MHVLLKSLIFVLLPAQAHFAYGGPCKPSSSTSIGQVFTVTTASDEISTFRSATISTILSSETNSATTLEISSILTTGSELPVTTVSTATSLSLAVSELSSTTTLGEASTTTAPSGFSTSNALPDAVTTTSIDIPLGTTLTAILVQDGSEVNAFLPMDDVNYENSYIISDPTAKSAGALFGLDPETSRLYAILPNGERLYAVSCIQCSGYQFRFLNEEQRQLEYFVAYARCTEGENRYLNCIPEGGPEGSYPYMYFYQIQGVRYFQTRDSGRRGQPAVEFRLG